MSDPIPTRSLLDNIRHRPAMYVGDLDLFGFIHYLVGAYSILFDHGARCIETEVGPDGVHLRSDADLGPSIASSGLLSLFEQPFTPVIPERYPSYGGLPLAALSEVRNDGARQNIRPFLLAGDVGKKGAGLFRAAPLSLKDRDRGTEPLRATEDYPWFWCEAEPGTDPAGGKEFVGARWNQVHLSLGAKRAAARSPSP